MMIKILLLLLQVIHASALNVLSFGAIADGKFDCTSAFQKCLDTAKTNQSDCYAPAGSYNLSDILIVDSVALYGDGNGEEGGKVTLLIESSDANQAIKLVGNGASVSNIRKIAYSTVRGSTPDSTAVWVTGTNFAVRNVSINGGKSAGIFMQGASIGIVEYNYVKHTLADAIHNTACTSSIIINNNVVIGAGDDGVAVVSYLSDNCLVNNITAFNNSITNQAWGRSMSVVGGSNVHYFYNYIRNSSHAAIYIASEDSYKTYNVHNVYVQNNIVVDGGGYSHAAVMLTAENNDNTFSDNVKVLNNVISSSLLQAVRAEGSYLFGAVVAGNTILNTNSPAFYINYPDPHPVYFIANQVLNVSNAPFAITAMPTQAALFMDSNYFYNVYASDNYAEVLHTQPGTALSALQVTFNTLVQPDSEVSGRFINVQTADNIFIYENNSPWPNVVGNNSLPYPMLIATNFTVQSSNNADSIVVEADEFFDHTKNVNNKQLTLLAVTNAVNGVVFLTGFTSPQATFYLTNDATSASFLYTVTDGLYVSTGLVTITI